MHFLESKATLVKKKIIFCFLFLVLIVYNKPVTACHVTSLTIDSITNTAGTFSVYLKLCVGYGKTGVPLGADGATLDFGFMMWSPTTVNVTSFPPNVTGNTVSNNTFEGALAGPGFGFGEKENLVYYDPFGGGASYTCVSSTAACGNIGTYCKQFKINFTGALPDSIRAWGIEGNGNPFAGCWPNNDMVVQPSKTAVLPIKMLYFNAYSEKNFNMLEWATASETNNDHFEIQKSQDGANWTFLDNIKGAGNSSYTKKYAFADYYVEPGYNYYRLKQIDLDGRYSYSSINAVDNSQRTDLEVIRTIDLYGRDVDKTYQGIFIEIYSDGTSRMKYANPN